MASRSQSRTASHAGSWYDADGAVLSSKLKGWLSNATESHAPARAIIAPHAGYSYCGECGGFAYRQVKPHGIKRVFILGPSHHFHLRKCALSAMQVYDTPLYTLQIDQQVYSELHGTGKFDVMSKDVDEAEHSIEMHLPYVAQVMESCKGNFTIVPIMVGNVSPQSEREYGRLLAPYLADKENLFVISSDFCHWGSRFQYTRYDESKGKIYQSIEHLDRQGMELIEKLNTQEFYTYLNQTENTICGRHPILVLLHTIEALIAKSPGTKAVMKFTQYAQSSKVQSMRDSSVSYASAALVLTESET